MTFEDNVLIEAHKRCIRHRDEVLASKACGCFYCCKIFAPIEIEEWTDNDQTAICPECGIDAILGDNSGYPVAAPDFLTAMHARWFERTVYVEY